MSVDFPAPVRTLPADPSLEYDRNLARELARARTAGQPAALQRIRDRHPRFVGAADDRILAGPFTLADAQLVIAREYGFSTWRALKKKIEFATKTGQLKAAIDQNDVPRVRELVAADKALLYAPMGYGGAGPLTWAAECRGAASPPTLDRLEIARLLIDAGADVHVSGDAPLMRAALYGLRIPMMELLVAHGADVNAYWAGHYPIIFAPCETLAPEALAWLLDHGADPTVRSGEKRDGGTALDMVIGTYSRGAGQQECARLLIQAGATSQFSDLPTMDMHAGRLDRLADRLDRDPELIHRRFPEMEYGSTAHRGMDLQGGTLLHAAAEYGDVEAIRMLIQHGADVNARAHPNGDGSLGQTPLYHAVSQYFNYGVPAAELLIQSGADLTVRARTRGRYDYPDEYVEVTPLGYAVRFPYAEWTCSGAVDLLLQRNAPAGDVFAAARLGRVEELKALLDSGADPNLCGPEEDSALQAAEAAGHREAVELLVAAGAVSASPRGKGHSTAKA